MVRCLVFFLLLSVIAWGQETRSLTLEQAIAQAVRDNPGVRRLAFEIETQGGRAAPETERAARQDADRDHSPVPHHMFSP